MDIDSAGWLSHVERVPSPNFDRRPEGMPVELLVIHAISLPPGKFGGTYINELFQNRLDPLGDPYFASIQSLRVSAHFLIDRSGHLTQYVSVFDRAWHAGVSCWMGRERCNDFSIGIELEGCDELEFLPSQYAVLNALIAILKTQFPIVDVVGHSDVAPGRKTDPGPCFDWQQLNCCSASGDVDVG
jgi:AmpD protein